MLRALKRIWGERRVCRVLEDGGNESTNGIAAKRRAHTRALTLPQRTPEFMPLDARLRKQIEDRMAVVAPGGAEARADFLTRLPRTALALPRDVVRKAIEQTLTVLAGIIAADGYRPKRD